MGMIGGRGSGDDRREGVGSRDDRREGEWG